TLYVLLSTLGVIPSLFSNASMGAGLVGNTRSTMVMLLDNSYSMEAGGGGVGAGEGATTNYAELQRNAEAVIRNLPRGSELAVIMMGGSATPLTDEATFDVELVRDRIAKSQAGFGAADVIGSFDAGVSALNKARSPKRDLVVLSDFQKVDWQDTAAAARARITELIKQMPVKPSVTFFRTG